jgi:3-keto-disaccharide hydrolase
MRHTPGVIAAGVCAVATILGGAVLAQAPAGGAQQPAGGQQPAAGQGEGRGQGRGQGRGGPRGAQPLNFEDRTGFQSIFDGTMKNWDGDTTLWKAEGGALVGTTTAENPLKENTFVIWRGGEVADFELKLEYRMSSTNSGIQFRSAMVPPGGEGRGAVTGKWVLKGYQADIDFANQFTGMIYEERGRGFLMQRGQAVEIGPDGVSRQIGSLEMNADELKSLIKAGEWNTVHLIARGNTIMNIVNGHVTAFIVDDDAKGRAMKGLLGFQIHVGPPMKIEFRNIFLKTLK